MFCTWMFLVSIPDIAPNEALLPILTPSTSMAVPKAAFPAETPPSLTDSTLAAVKSGLTVLPPGRRAATSATLDICRWSRAFLSKTRVVFIASSPCLAVTVTSSRAKVFSSSIIRRYSMSPRTSRLILSVTYPRQETSKV